jgi:hypothetical protein
MNCPGKGADADALIVRDESVLLIKWDLFSSTEKRKREGRQK